MAVCNWHKWLNPPANKNYKIARVLESSQLTTEGIFFMQQAFVLGNGQSRQGMDLSRLASQGTIYGCNALYRDFEPAVLVATDRAIAEAIQQTGYAKSHCFYTRKPIPGLGAQAIPRPYWPWSSGPVALALAAESGYRKIWLLGFDLGPTPDQRFNNVYAGTEFYKARDAAPTYVGNWVQQIQSVTAKFDRTEFYRVCGPTTAPIAQFQNLPNLREVTVPEFWQQLNTQLKDTRNGSFSEHQQ